MDVVLPALLTGTTGLAVGWFLQARKQQGEKIQWFQAQMLDAADEFEKAIQHAQAQMGVADAWQTSKPDEAREQLRNVRIAVGATHQRLPRIDLLFGPDSDTAQAARDEILVLGGLWHAGEQLLDAQAEDDGGHTILTKGDVKETSELFIKAAAAVENMDTTFRKKARAAIAEPKLPG